MQLTEIFKGTKQRNIIYFPNLKASNNS